MHLFLGNGPRLQYEDVEQVWRNLTPVLQDLDGEAGGPQHWLAVFGGDSNVGYGYPAGYDMGRVREQEDEASMLSYEGAGDGNAARAEGNQAAGRGWVGRR